MRPSRAGALIVLSMACAAIASILATRHETNGTYEPAVAARPAASTASSAVPAMLPRDPSMAIPPSLANTDIPTLSIDSGGHLAHTRQVRDFFDYYLAAQHQIAPLTLDLMVKNSIASQLGRKPAAIEAVDLWKRYRAYLDAVAQLPQPQGAPGDTLDFDAVALALNQYMALADRFLGEGGWNEVFFGEQLKIQRIDLERMRIQADTSLSTAEKAAQSLELDKQMPADERAWREHSRQQDDDIAHALALRAQGASPEQQRDAIAASLGPEAAERAEAMAKSEHSWQARYAQYARERMQIDQQHLATQQRDEQVTQLRQRFFTTTAELTRAAAFDRATVR